MTLKDLYLSGNKFVFPFKNIFNFITFCWENTLTPENSTTYYDVVSMTIYIRPNKYANNT